MAADLVTTERLTLEPLALHHVDEMVEVLSSPALYRFTGGDPLDVEELTGRYQRQLAGPAGADEAWRNWVVRVDGRAVGFVQATLTLAEGLAELSWLVQPSDEGRGIATEAAAAMVKHLRARNGVTSVHAHISDERLASQAVARGIGLSPTERFVAGERVWSDAAGPSPR
ncbi:MAG: GCN5-related N-acetyltransferase [Frankiales bacterium]|nr:GCN5-related N-acetyltransferase [Frankiales bacterium]